MIARIAILALVTIVSAFGQTITLNETSPYTARRIGLNVAANGREGSVFANMITENPGMQPTENAMIVSVPASPAPTTTTFGNGDGWEGMTANQYAGGTFQVLCAGSETTGTPLTQTCLGVNGPTTWSDTLGASGSLGCHGTIASNTADNTSTGVGGVFTISAACPAAFQQNAEVLVRAPVSATTQATITCGDNCWGWNKVVTGSGTIDVDTTAADMPAGSQGVQVIGFDTSAASGSTAGLQAICCDIGTDYYFSGQYTQSIEVKVVSGTGLSITFSGARGSGANWSQTVAIPAGSGWQTISATFAVTNPESATAIGSGAMQINFVLSGQGKVLVWNPQLYVAGTTDYFNTASTLLVQNMGAGDCRLWGGSPQNATTVANWAALPQNIMPASVQTDNNNSAGASPLPTSLNLFLQAAQQMGCTGVQIVAPVTLPWSDASGSGNDVQHLIEFLNGPSSTTLGALRITEGGPSANGGWSSVFDHIDISYGNEVWNGAAGNESMPLYSVGSTDMWAYSLLVSQWCGAAHGSPYWQSNDWCDATVNPGDNGYWTNLIHTRDAFGGTVDSVSFNGYTMQQPITDCTTPNLYLSSQTEAVWGNNHVASNDTGFYSSVQAAKSDGYHVMVYEYQNSTDGAGGITNNCTQAEINGYADGLGYGVIDAVQALEGEQQLGITDWNFFTIYQTTFGFTSTAATSPATTTFIWGIQPQLSPSAYDNPRPSYYALQMANQCIGTGGTGYPVTWTSNPTYNFAALNGITAANNVPYLYGYEYANGASRCLVIANLDPSASHTVAVGGTNAPSGSVTQIELTSAGIADNNDAPTSAGALTVNPAIVVQPATSTLTNPTSFTIPAHSMVTETWAAAAPVLGTVNLSGNVTASGGVVIQ